MLLSVWQFMTIFDLITQVERSTVMQWMRKNCTDIYAISLPSAAAKCTAHAPSVVLRPPGAVADPN